MKRPFRLSRRAMLGGAGALIALPWLEAMLPFGRRATASDEETPLRLLCYYMPNGFHMPSWTPQTAGPGYDLPLILEPLAAVQEDITVLTGLANYPAKPEGPGDHAGGTSAFLTATHVNKSETEIQNNISVDQVIANAKGDLTTHASLQFGTQGGGNAGGCDSGYSCAYTRNISWADPVTPIPKLTQPQVIFDLLFSGFDPEATAEELEKRRAQRLSVLDYALTDIETLEQKLGATDRMKLDQYLTGLRDLEMRIEAEDNTPQCMLPDFNGAYQDFEAHVDLMTDLMVLAFECDMTRIVTFMLENAGSYRTYDFLNVPGAHHEISHHQNMPENFGYLEIINRWEMEQFAKLVTRLKQIPEGDGTMLDNSLIFLSSEISDGNAHNHDNLPVILAGSACGKITPGRHVVYEGDPPIANLFLSMLDMFGTPQASFGDDSTGLLPDLKV